MASTRQRPTRLRAVSLSRAEPEAGSPPAAAKSRGLGHWARRNAAIGRSRLRTGVFLKPLRFFSEYVVRPVPAKQFSRPRNHFPVVVQMSGNSPPVSSCPTNGRACRDFGDRLM